MKLYDLLFIYNIHIICPNDGEKKIGKSKEKGNKTCK